MSPNVIGAIFKDAIDQDLIPDSDGSQMYSGLSYQKTKLKPTFANMPSHISLTSPLNEILIARLQPCFQKDKLSPVSQVGTEWRHAHSATGQFLGIPVCMRLSNL